MLLVPNALCWSSRKCNCACALSAEVQLRLRVTCRSWQKLFAGKNFVKILVTAQTQLRSYSEQQRAFGNSNICNLIVISPTNLYRDLQTGHAILQDVLYRSTYWYAKCTDNRPAIICKMHCIGLQLYTSLPIYMYHNFTNSTQFSIFFFSFFFFVIFKIYTLKTIKYKYFHSVFDFQLPC